MIKSIKATRKLPDGIYIRGTAQGYPPLFTTDTGASKTIISSRVYESFKPEDRPKLERSSKLVGAGGVSIKELKGTFTLQLGPVSMQTEAIVAEIDDDGLLGVDVLQNGMSKCDIRSKFECQNRILNVNIRYSAPVRMSK